MLMEMAKIFQEVDRLGGTRVGTEGEGHLVSQSAIGIAFRAAKRSFDIAASVVGMVVLSPLLLATAVAVKFTSQGPVIFKQKRYGKDEVPFTCYKFRTMKIDTPPNIPTRVMREDKAVMTPIGAMLRKTSMASVIIGTPGAGEPTNSLSSAAKTSFDQQFYDRRPEVSPATQSIIPAPNSCLFTFFGGSRKAQYELEARADGADQGGSPWRGKASSSMIEKGAYCLTPALGVAA